MPAYSSTSASGTTSTIRYAGTLALSVSPGLQKLRAGDVVVEVGAVLEIDPLSKG